jgi:hypothetical protein
MTSEGEFSLTNRTQNFSGGVIVGGRKVMNASLQDAGTLGKGR